MGERLKVISQEFSDGPDALRSLMVHLYDARKACDSGAVKLLSRQTERLIKSNGFDLEGPDSGGNTLIMDASSLLLYDIVDQLILKGANVLARNNNNEDALSHLDDVGHTAFSNSHNGNFSLQRRYSYTRSIIKGAMDVARQDHDVKMKLAYSKMQTGALKTTQPRVPVIRVLR